MGIESVIGPIAGAATSSLLGDGGSSNASATQAGTVQSWKLPDRLRCNPPKIHIASYNPCLGKDLTDKDIIGVL